MTTLETSPVTITALPVPAEPQQTVEYWTCEEADRYSCTTVDEAIEAYLDSLGPHDWPDRITVMAMVEADDQDGAEAGEMLLEHDQQQDVVLDTAEWVSRNAKHWLSDAATASWVAARLLSNVPSNKLLESLPAFAKDCTPGTLTRLQALCFIEYLRRQATYGQASSAVTYGETLLNVWLPWLLQQCVSEEVFG